MTEPEQNEPGSAPVAAEGVLTLEQRIELHGGALSRTERRVADYIVANAERVVFLSALQLAKLTRTSDATVIRTAKALGFTGWPELKHDVGATLMTSTHPAHRLATRITVARETDSTSLLEIVFDEAAERIRETQRSLSAESFDDAVELIGTARTVVTFGLGLSRGVAEYCAVRLRRLGISARTAPHMGFALADDLLLLDRGDVVVLFAPGRLLREVEIVIEHAEAVGASVILVTDTLPPEIGTGVRAVLRAPLSAGGLTGETLTASVVTDALLLSLARRGEERATRTSKILTQLRKKLIGKGRR
ncbi:DNA-binding MurR/RpiR family transcriptional regulator [Spinactinospora alkalitolerans]|uniref:DNA-binding MurR/RpiR family transcriptional regulator n=1 Tax=Spinactinospora alkalitolerans TaxID=687207 RepID=A0A852U297_9ACTN|nr:MurR/RpiR family transcriptional regulator [Spinactinospora alkalitolerans]NYE48100.1 DNA-binding MurR/RpiR family transcriptional regulator [Spinactinospora alkalitolerans]